MLQEQQQKRVDKLNYEEFYLIGFTDKTNTDDNSEILMTGSTKNVYKINLKKNGALNCDCPDSKSHAKKHNVVCKHICFIYLKICKSTDMNFFVNKKLTSLDIGKLILRTSVITKTNTAQKYMDNYLKNTNVNLDKLDFNKASRVIEDLDELECPICFDNMAENLNFCPDCSNPIHKKCVEKWLISNNTCVYCRSEIWKNYGDNGPIKKINSGGYNYVKVT
jgi:hypothetical protein